MERKLHANWRRDRATGFHCGKCGKVFTPVVSLGKAGAPVHEVLRAFEAHQCVESQLGEEELLAR